jgi:hypothetical protein
MFKIKTFVIRLMLCITLLILLSSCFQMTSGDQLNTNPVTNNPNLIPSGQQGPYTY